MECWNKHRTTPILHDSMTPIIPKVQTAKHLVANTPFFATI